MCLSSPAQRSEVVTDVVQFRKATESVRRNSVNQVGHDAGFRYVMQPKTCSFSVYAACSALRLRYARVRCEREQRSGGSRDSAALLRGVSWRRWTNLALIGRSVWPWLPSAKRVKDCSHGSLEPEDIFMRVEQVLDQARSIIASVQSLAR